MNTYTCFACFTDTEAMPPAFGHDVRCAQCGVVLISGADLVPLAEAVDDFGVSDADRKAMTQGKVADAYAAEAESNAILKAVFRGMS